MKNTRAITGKKLPEYSIQAGWRSRLACRAFREALCAPGAAPDAVGRQTGVLRRVARLLGVELGQRRVGARAALPRQHQDIEEPDHAGDQREHEQDQGEITEDCLQTHLSSTCRIARNAS
jgi:hypothetical protein